MGRRSWEKSKIISKLGNQKWSVWSRKLVFQKELLSYQGQGDWKWWNRKWIIPCPYLSSLLLRYGWSDSFSVAWAYCSAWHRAASQQICTEWMERRWWSQKSCTRIMFSIWQVIWCRFWRRRISQSWLGSLSPEVQHRDWELDRWCVDEWATVEKNRQRDHELELRKSSQFGI